jgi:hypothetical protein
MTRRAWPHEPDPPDSTRIRPYLTTPVTGSPAHGTGKEAPRADLRPFVLTAGRVTGLDPEISMETQVTARPVGARSNVRPVEHLAPELQAILLLCAEPISVVEISGQLRFHLGVTRVLVGDLRAAGYLDVHALDPTHSHDPDMILRVMRGLRAIS